MCSCLPGALTTSSGRGWGRTQGLENFQGYPWKTAPSIPAAGAELTSIPSVGTDPLRTAGQSGMDPKELQALRAALTSGMKLQPWHHHGIWDQPGKVLEAAGNGTRLYHQAFHESRSSGRFWDMSQEQYRVHEHSHQHLRTLICCCQQGRTFPVLPRTPAGTRSSRRPSLLSRSRDVAELNRTRSKEQTQLFSAWPWVFHLKLAAIKIFHFGDMAPAPGKLWSRELLLHEVG